MNTILRGAAFMLLLSACATPPPAYQMPEGYFGLRSVSALPTPQVPDIPALVPRWQPLSAGGELSVMAGKIHKPRLEFWALKIDLAYTADAAVNGRAGGQPPGAGEPLHLRIVLGAGEGGFPRPGYVLSTRVASFVLNKGLLAGINTVPFDPASAREGEERRLAGIAVAGGLSIAPPAPRYDALVFYSGGGAAIVGQAELEGEEREKKERILHAAGGFHRILRDGELTDRALRKAAGPRHARSAAGLSSGTLYLMVINGGAFWGRRGATEAEAALILKQLGARDALNLDGGGSSALALRFSDGGVRTLNSPARFPGGERAVGLCLGIGPG
jgi:hypothetical protein